MKSIVILGCGFAGLEAAFWLKKLATPEITVSVVSPSDTMVYMPSLIWLPPRRKKMEDISFDVNSILLKKGIDFYMDEAITIEPEANKVHLKSGAELPYDYLLIAAGWKAKRSHIRGNENVLFPCAISDALELTRIIGEMQSGVITFAIEGERPGPGAEYLGWIDVYLRENGIRDRFELNLVEEKHRLLIHLGKVACDMLTANFTQRGIHLYLGEKLVEARPGTAILSNGVEIGSDLICSVGKVEAPEFLHRLDFSVEDGFIPAKNDLLCTAFDNIYVAGDVADFGRKNVPKVAHISINQGEIAAKNIHAEITGAKKHYFDPEHAFENLYILSDFGETAVLVKGLKSIKHGVSMSHLKESIERYYLHTHRLGLTWELI